MIKINIEQETSQKYAMKEIMSQAKGTGDLPEGDYILIMPFASSWQDKEGKWHENAKNYPYWNELVKAIKLTFPKLKVIQTGLGMEPAIDGIDEKRPDLTLQQMRDLLLGSKTFISSDTYLQHAGAKYGKRGIVLWGQNNPKHFGHKLHENLYANSQFFRKETWAVWQGYPRNNESFVRPGVVLAALKEELKRQKPAPIPIDEAYPPIPGVSWAPKFAKELRGDANTTPGTITTAALDTKEKEITLKELAVEVH
jgi:ADP-heptose:LPS heptosyltransferase